jgi:hypothetical protein
MRSAPRSGRIDITHVSVDGVMQGLGGPDEDRQGGFERGGWALPLFVNDNEAVTFVNQVYQRADAFLFGRTYEIFAGSWGVMADADNPSRRRRTRGLSTSHRPRSPTRNGRTRPSCPVTPRPPSAS